MIKDTFTNEYDSITAICFVEKSTESRLTYFQKYILFIIKIFGNNMRKNFIAMLNFCDGDKPNIMNY